YSGKAAAARSGTTTRGPSSRPSARPARRSGGAPVPRGPSVGGRPPRAAPLTPPSSRRPTGLVEPPEETHERERQEERRDEHGEGDRRAVAEAQVRNERVEGVHGQRLGGRAGPAAGEHVHEVEHPQGV